MSVQVIEMVVKCRVPREDTEEYILKFRDGQKVVPVPEGLTCKDAFAVYDNNDVETAIIRAGFGP